MKCNHCGFEHTENFSFCQNCGAPSSTVEPVSLNPVHDKVLEAIKNPLFLILCILSSANCIFSIAAQSMPLINILITVFLWLTYAQSFKGIADENNLRSISGCVYANYVIVNVVSLILMVCGGIITFLSTTISDSKEFFETIEADLMVEFPELFKPFEYELNQTIYEFSLESQDVLFIFFLVIGILLLVLGVAALLFNILGYRKIHRFVKSVHEGITYQNPEFYKPAAARNWLIFFTVCSIISLVNTLISYDYEYATIIASTCNIVCQIISIILVDHHFVTKKA